MSRVFTIFCTAATALFLATGPLAAQRPDPQPLEGNTDSDRATETKDPGIFFHRPVHDTPEEQFAYAERLREQGKLWRARKAYNALVHEWHESPLAAKAQFAYAELLMQKEKYLDAFDEFQYLVDHFAGQFPYNMVLENQFKIANHYRNKRSFDFFGMPGFKHSEKALELFEKVVANGPSWDKADEAQFYVGLMREDLKDYPEAVLAYERLAQVHPGSRFAEAAAFRHAVNSGKIAEDRPRDEGAARDAISILSAFVVRYPDSEFAAEANDRLDQLRESLAEMYFERALFYDKRAKNPKSALIAYTDFVKNFPLSEKTEAAMKRIDTLKEEVARTDGNPPNKEQQARLDRKTDLPWLDPSIDDEDD